MPARYLDEDIDASFHGSLATQECIEKILPSESQPPVSSYNS
jgi:hypothetical protein